MSYAERLVKGSAIVFIMYLVGGVIGYATRLYLAHTLTVAEFGLFYAIISFAGFLTVFRDPGLSSAMTKYIAEFNAKKDMVSVKSTLLIVIALELLLAIAVTAIVIVFSGYLATSYFKTSEAIMPLEIIMFSYIVSAFVIIQFLFQGIGKIKYYSIVEPVRNVSTFLFILLFIYLGVTGVALGYLMGAIILVVIMFILAVKSFPFFSIKSNISRGLTKKIVSFGAPIFLTGVSGTILGNIDTIVITFFLSTSEVGFYQAAFSTSQLLWVLSGTATVVLFPMVAELWAKNDRATLSKIIGLLIKFSFILVIPAVLVFAAFPEVIIRMLFGSEFLPAAVPLQILALSSLFYPIFAITTNSIVGIGKPGINMKIVALTATLNLILNIILVPYIGITGAATATAMSYLIGTIIALRYLRANVKFKVFPVDMLKAFIGGVITFVVIIIVKTLLDTNPWIELIASATIGLVVYATIIVMSRAVKREEIDLIAGSGIALPKFFKNLFR
jgi:stage V sporulation protein B